uniref:Uncharacterized protein n=1 Tax=Utricularia reniformis TaxID=192314 RepID=A0A1Y0B340_9LAMI|nr:hypothetical protein AEK19_MT1674 [Utricularia reniformis]ART31856.1 hypothetical protein AEK19_MT1674 [Utricularia reniformis]
MDGFQKLERKRAKLESKAAALESKDIELERLRGELSPLFQCHASRASRRFF